MVAGMGAEADIEAGVGVGARGRGLAARLGSVLVWCVLLVVAGEARAQFGTPGSTTLREDVAGQLLPGEGGITPENGDQIGAFFEDELVGSFSFTSSSRDFRIRIFGDDDESDEREGLRVGQRVEFRFFDASTNNTLTLAVINEQGESVNFTFQGQVVFEIPGLPLDLTPTRLFDLRSGGGGSGGGDGGGGGGGEPDVGADLNEDGSIDVRDAAIVLRMIGSGVRPGTRVFFDLGIAVRGGEGDREQTAPPGGVLISASSLMSRADVDNDGAVTTQDAVVILKSR